MRPEVKRTKSNENREKTLIGRRKCKISLLRQSADRINLRIKMQSKLNEMELK